MKFNLPRQSKKNYSVSFSLDITTGSHRQRPHNHINVIHARVLRRDHELCRQRLPRAQCSILLHRKTQMIVDVLQDDTDPMVSVMKFDKVPTESNADVEGLDQQIQEMKEAVELPLTNTELYEEMGIRPPKGAILYGVPGTGKTLLAKAVANQMSATFLRVVGSELIQKYLGDRPKLVRELFRVAEEYALNIVFIDEIDSIARNVTSQLLVASVRSSAPCSSC
ncbi:P-loop containing nucleoside triphosphate hydrolase protein [Phellopilus nigrolimitatus]|nr:P-loop containing nucleoside triphosphate hydrolase protein [Phellopilus nigrolimitatus]